MHAFKAFFKFSQLNKFIDYQHFLCFIIICTTNIINHMTILQISQHHQVKNFLKPNI